jgi:hypothetical protein
MGCGAKQSFIIKQFDILHDAGIIVVGEKK